MPLLCHNHCTFAISHSNKFQSKFKQPIPEAAEGSIRFKSPILHFAMARMAKDLQVRGQFADGQILSTVVQGLRPGATLMDLRLALADACGHPSMLIRFHLCSRPGFSPSFVVGSEILNFWATLESLNLNGYIYVRLGPYCVC